MVLEIEHPDLMISPVEFFAIHKCFDQFLLADPVNFSVQVHGVASEFLDHVLPLLDHVLHNRVNISRSGITKRGFEILGLQLHGGHLLAVVEGEFCLASRVMGNLLDRTHRIAQDQAIRNGAIFDH